MTSFGVIFTASTAPFRVVLNGFNTAKKLIVLKVGLL